jgi:hypothetical protein
MRCLVVDVWLLAIEAAAAVGFVLAAVAVGR